MKPLVKSMGACLCAGLATIAQANGPSLPEPGRWELAVSLRGGPVKDPPPTTVCLQAQDLAGAPERAFLNAAMRSLPMEPKGEPQCAVTDLARDADKSSWQARCNGPRGPMQGAGKGTLSEQAVSLEQGFGIDTPFGRQMLSQTIRARRVGSCQ